MLPGDHVPGHARRRSRLRIVCPAFPALNIYSRPAKVMTALGPICVATAVQNVANWDAEVVDENNYWRGPTDSLGRPDHAALQQIRPADVVGLYGGLTSTIPRLLEVARLYKAAGALVIAGGQHFVPDNVEHVLRNGVDLVVLGEGEKAIVELLTRIGGGGGLGNVRSIAYLAGDKLVLTAPRDPITDFDELPLPDFSILRHARMKYYPVSGVRGCGMNCEFCAVKGRPRSSTAERIMEQFASVYERWGGKVFFVVDDLFGQDRQEALRLCAMLRDYQMRMKVRFAITVQIRLDKATDDQLLTAMRGAGIRVLAIGFESPIPQELLAMHKGLRPDDMIALTRRYRRAGFRIHGMFIFGYPGPQERPFQMPAVQREIHFTRFLRRASLDTIQVLLPIPLPGTELARRLADQNRVFATEHVGLQYYDGNFPLFEPDPPLTPEDMHAAVRRIMRRFYGPRHLLAVAGRIMTFPAIVLWLHDLGAGWQQWYRGWIGSVYRSGGWLLLRKWTAAFRKDNFFQKLAEAKRHLPRRQVT